MRKIQMAPTAAAQQIVELTETFVRTLSGLLMDHNHEVYDRVRALLLGGLAGRTEKPAKARKPARGRRHCGKCGSTKHDARNCDGKGKKAVLSIAKAA